MRKAIEDIELALSGAHGLLCWPDVRDDRPTGNVTAVIKIEAAVVLQIVDAYSALNKIANSDEFAHAHFQP